LSFLIFREDLQFENNNKSLLLDAHILAMLLSNG